MAGAGAPARGGGRRRDALIAALAAHAPSVHATGIAAGLHAVLQLPPGTEDSVVRAAVRRGLAVHGLTTYRHPDSATERSDALDSNMPHPIGPFKESITSLSADKAIKHGQVAVGHRVPHREPARYSGPYEPDGGAHMGEQRRRLRSSTVVLGGMGVVAAALTSCGSDPDRRCVDRDSYDYANGYKIIADKNCNASSTSSSYGKNRKSNSSGNRSQSGSVDAAWYYDSDVSGGRADYGTFSRSEAVDRDGFGCSGSGSSGG